MKVIITESAKNRLLKRVIKEEFGGLSDKVNIVKSFLDKNFLKATNSEIGENGHPKLHDICIWVDAYKQPKQYMNDSDIFYVLQDEFKNIIPEDEDGTHNSRDKFLKQCLKDWYYNKISKRGNLSLYEGYRDVKVTNIGRNNGKGNSGSYKFNGWGLKDAANVAQQEMDLEPEILRYWDDTTTDGIKIIGDINYLLTAFNNKRKSAGKNKFRIICDDYLHNVSETSKDLFNTLRSIYKTRAAFKWCFICRKFAKNLDMNTIKYILHQISSTNISLKQDFEKGTYNLFETTNERDLCLPYFKDFSLNYLKAYNTSQLKTEIDSSNELTDELNEKVEQFLDSLGYEKAEIFKQNKDILDIDIDF